MRNELADQDGNLLFFERTWVRLRLRSEPTRIRTLGEVRGDTFFAMRQVGKHEMENRKEYGFNYHLIKYGLFRNIVVRTDGGQEFRTTRRWVLKRGNVHRPGGVKFELQIFLSLAGFVGFVEPQEEPEQREKRHSVQESLFTEYAA